MRSWSRAWLRLLALSLVVSACQHVEVDLPQPPPVSSEPRVARTSGQRPAARVPSPRTHAAPRLVTPGQSQLALSPALSRPAAARIAALGDLHGDMEATRKALQLAGAIDASDQWIGGELVLVQTGDVLDRGDDDRLIVDLLERLRGEAEQAGGAVLALSGNHEVMNVALDFGYVTPGGFAAFEAEGGRENAFHPGGRYAAILAQRPIVMKVGDNVFVHGGVLPKHVRYGLDRMNNEVRSWMLGQLAWPPNVVLEGDGLLWTRLYSYPAEPADCAQLEEALALLGARRMIVGHTPQLTGITSDCGERVWRIDTGMSRFYGGPVQALAIEGDTVRVLAASPPN